MKLFTHLHQKKFNYGNFYLLSMVIMLLFPKASGLFIKNLNLNSFLKSHTCFVTMFIAKSTI